MRLSHTSLNPLSAATAHNIHYLDHAYLPHPLDCSLLAKDRERAVMSWAYFLLHRGLFPHTIEHTWEVGVVNTGMGVAITRVECLEIFCDFRSNVILMNVTLP